MTIFRLMADLKELAGSLPNGLHTQVVAWVRVPHVGESAVLEVSDIQQGYRITHGGPIATLCLDCKA
jgi:hypothetical protein